MCTVTFAEQPLGVTNLSSQNGLVYLPPDPAQAATIPWIALLLYSSNQVAPKNKRQQLTLTYMEVSPKGSQNQFNGRLTSDHDRALPD